MIEGKSVALHVEDHGSGAPLLLLHGWPDSSYLWREQIPALTAAGFRAIAPDLRGFGCSEAPADVDSYVVEHLVADVIGLMDRLEIESAGVVGHGWGAGVAWMLATHAPERVDRMVTLGIAHPGAALVESLGHYEKTWYQAFFHFEGIAEAHLKHNDWQLFREFLHDSPDTDHSIEELSRPGALEASLNVFRANMKPRLPGPPPAYPQVEASVLAIWTPGDGAKGLAKERLLDSERFVDGTWRFEEVEGGHWLPVDDPDRVNALLLDWFGS